MSLLDDITPYLEGAFLAGQIEDLAETGYIARHPDTYHENNPLMGKHPSPEKVNTFMPLAGLAQYEIYNALPDKYKALWAGISLGEQAVALHGNAKSGIPYNYYPMIPLTALFGNAISKKNKNKLSVSAGRIPNTNTYGPMINMEW